jgi:hypothetical protein
MADKKYLSKIVKGSDTLWIKDAQAWADIADIYSKISGGLHYLGKSTTPIADGDATGPWVIDGVTYVVSGAVDPQKNLSAGDIAIYGESEFIWSGAAGKWQEFGSTGSLGALAFKDSASGDYTPAGTNQASAVSFTGTADGDFVTGYNNDAVAPSKAADTFTPNTLASFTEGAFVPAEIQAGFYTPGTAPSFTEGAYTPAAIENGFVTAGVAASYSHSGFEGGSLGAESKSAFATEGEVSSYNESEETLTLSAATTSQAVTAQGTFTPAVYGTDTFDGGTPTAIDTTKFSGGSKAADTWNAGAVTVIDVTKFDGGSKAADSFNAGSQAAFVEGAFNPGSAATLATSKAITALGSAEAAAQVFSGTQATITVE